MNEINGQLRFHHATFDPLLSVWRYQHGDNPEHVLELTLRVLIDDPAEHWRAVGEWVGRVHEYEAQGLAAMLNEEAS